MFLKWQGQYKEDYEFLQAILKTCMTSGFFCPLICDACVFMFIANLCTKSTKMIAFLLKNYETVETLKLGIFVSFHVTHHFVCLLNVLYLINSLWLHCVCWFFLLCLYWTIWAFYLSFCILNFGTDCSPLQLLVPSTTG